MKGLKIVAFVVGGIVVLVAIVFALALMPSVQTWAVRKAVAGQPGMTIEVSRVAAGLSAAEITNLRYAKDGIVITAKGVTAKYSALDYLTKKRINVDSVSVDDLVIDLRSASPTTTSTGPRPPSPAPTSGPATPGGPRPATGSVAEKKVPFEGLLKQAQLPFDVRLALLTAKGRALLPNNQLVTFDLKGAGIETGQRGKLEWTADLADSTPGAALRGLRATGEAAVRITADRRIDLIEVETTAAAMGPKISADPVKLTAKAEKLAGVGNENYAATLSLVRADAVEPILKTSAQYVGVSSEIIGAWFIALRTEQLAGLLAGLGLPELAATGAGKFSFKPGTNAISASGDLQAQTAQLQKIMPELQAVGTVQLKTTFDGSMADNVARLDKLSLEVAGTDGRKFAEVSALQKITYNLGDKRVALVDPKAELARISLQALPLAWAQAFAKSVAIESGDLSMVLAVEAEPDGSRVRARAVEPLAIRNLTISQGANKIADRVSLSLRPNIDYSATKLTAQLTELVLTTGPGDGLTGNLSADVTNLATTPAVDFAAQFQGKIITLLKPYLPVDTGPLTIATTIEGRHEGQTLQLAKATATVSRDGGALLTALELQQPVRVDLKSSTFAVSNPTATAARVRLGELPLAWAEGFVAKSKLTGSLTAGVLDIALRTVDDLTVTTAEPVTLRAITATIDGKPLVQALDLSANFTATTRGDVITYELRKIEAKQGAAVLTAFMASGEVRLKPKLTLVAKGTLEADVAAFAAQPVLAPFATLSRGRVTMTFETRIADSTEVKAVVSAKNLTAKQENRALGDLDLNVTANVKADGSGSISVPLKLTTGNRISDATIDGAFGKASNKETFLFTGKITSNQIVVDDFQALAALAPSSPVAEAPQPARPAAPPRSTTPAPATRTSLVVRDAAPFWKGVNGKFELDLKRVLFGKDYDGGVRGTAVITDSRLAVEALEGKFKGNPFKVNAGMTFASQQAKPYALTGSVDVSGVEIGPILQAANPNEKPQLETSARIVGSFTGSGLNPTDLLNNTSGQFNVSGAKGTLRVISGKTGKAVGAVSVLAGLAGAAMGSNSTLAASTLLGELTDMPFDQFTMRVERGADLNLKLSAIEFISPSTRITGTGTITHQPNTPLVQQPIQVEMKLAGKQHMLRMLDEARVLGESVDEKGYGQMRAPFKVQGTVSQMQDNLFSVLLNSALQMQSDLRARKR